MLSGVRRPGYWRWLHNCDAWSSLGVTRSDDMAIVVMRMRDQSSTRHGSFANTLVPVMMHLLFGVGRRFRFDQVTSMRTS